MAGKRAAIAMVVLQFAAVTLFAQEYGRDSGGVIEATMKQSNTLSGSLGIGLTRSSMPFVAGSARNYNATLGGTVLKDRLWFFGSALVNDGARFNPVLSAIPARSVPMIALGNLSAQAGDRQSFAASGIRSGSLTALPSSFLSLHYTAILSSSSFVTASVTRQSSTLRPTP